MSVDTAHKKLCSLLNNKPMNFRGHSIDKNYVVTLLSMMLSRGFDSEQVKINEELLTEEILNKVLEGRFFWVTCEHCGELVNFNFVGGDLIIINKCKFPGGFPENIQTTKIGV